MVVAYLRGVLRRNHSFGIRSGVTEDIVLEAISAEHIAKNIQIDVMSNLALIPAFNQQAVISTAEKSATKLARASELRMFDIYKVAEQLAGKLKREIKSELSLYQVYQIAEKSGIFEALDAHVSEKDAKPLL